jgi:hypothetical protein
VLRISGKYFPSHLRTQKLGPELATPSSTGRGGCGGGFRLLLKTSLKKRVLVLLLLATAEKEIEQALSRTRLGCQHRGADDAGSNKYAAQLSLKG